MISGLLSGDWQGESGGNKSEMIIKVGREGWEMRGNGL